MHEFSTMQQIVYAIIEEARRYKAKEVSRVILQIGELTFLGEEQLKFAFDILKEDTIMENAELVIEKIKAEVRCECGYQGGIEYGLKEEFHLMFPILKCPRCGKEVEIIRGRECLIKSVEMEIEENVAVER